MGNLVHCTHWANLGHGHGVYQSLYRVQLHKVSAGVEDDAAVGKLRPVADPDVVEDDVGSGDVVVLHELEEGLEAVPEAEVVDGGHVGGEQGPRPIIGDCQLGGSIYDVHTEGGRSRNAINLWSNNKYFKDREGKKFQIFVDVIYGSSPRRTRPSPR